MTPRRFDPNLDHRRSVRLKTYDYARDSGVFVTICTHHRQPLFGHVVDDTVRLSEAGAIISECWSALPSHFVNLTLGEYVVMPNHVHEILLLGDLAGQTGDPGRGMPRPYGSEWSAATNSDAARPRGSAAGSVGSIVGSFKSAAARRVNVARGTARAPIWQRNYYEHVIRSDDEQRRISEYIAANPANWAKDDLFLT